MRNIRVVPAMAKCAVLCAILIVAACEPYVCVDGNLLSSPSNVNSKVKCLPDSTVQMCTNGTPGTNLAQCVVCDFGFILDGSRQCQQILTVVDSITDAGDLELDGASDVAIAVVGVTTYLFVAGLDDHGVSVFSVGTDGKLTSVFNATDADVLEWELGGASGVATATIGNSTYLYVTGRLDNGLSVFSVGANGALTWVQGVYDGENPLLTLRGAISATTTVIGNATYLTVAGFDDNGVSVFLVNADGTLTRGFRYADSTQDPFPRPYNLLGSASVATVTVGEATYLYVAAFRNDGLTIFSMDDMGHLALVGKVDDDADLKLRGATSVTTAVVGDITYLFAAGHTDNAINVFSVGADGNLTKAYVTDDLQSVGGARFVTTAKMESATYLFVAGQSDNGVGVFTVGADGGLTLIAKVDDTPTMELAGARSVATAVVEGTTYLFVSAQADDGISVFAVK